MYAKLFFGLLLFVVISEASTKESTTCLGYIEGTFCKAADFKGFDPKHCTAEWGAFSHDQSKDLVTKTNDLIKRHLSQSMKYLLVASRFNQWKINRPGFHNYFSKLADEEWDSGISLMIEMLKRGGKLEDFKVPAIATPDFKPDRNEMEALAWALDSEKTTAHDTQHLAFLANHPDAIAKGNVPQTVTEQSHKYRDAAFVDFLVERLNHNAVIRIKHMSNYLNILAKMMASSYHDVDNKLGVDKAFAMFTFDHDILK